MRLIFLAIAVLLDSTTAYGEFLDGCPFDRDQRLDNERILGVLETFYKDLLFVRASTESREARDYSRLSRDVEMNFLLETQTTSYNDTDQLFSIVIQLLQENRFRDAGILMYQTRHRDSFAGGWKLTYFKYLQAEGDRLFGLNKDASINILLAFLERQESRGVRVDDLERLDGLIALQKISQFNQEVDEVFGLRQSPDYHLLSLVHLMMKQDPGPLSEIRPTVSSRLFETAPSIGSPESSTSSNSGRSIEARRIDPSLNDFQGRSLSKTSVEGILCEFALKLVVLGISTRESVSLTDDYTGVIDQLRQVDPSFAEELNTKVVALIETRFERAIINANALWRVRLNSASYDAIKEMFMSYFKIELSRRSSDNCNIWTLLNLVEDMDMMKSIRQTHAGLSIGKVIELEGKVVFMWMKCFHKRVTLAYELDGTEDKHQLETKRAQFGTVERVIPHAR